MNSHMKQIKHIKKEKKNKNKTKYKFTIIHLIVLHMQK